MNQDINQDMNPDNFSAIDWYAEVEESNGALLVPSAIQVLTAAGEMVTANISQSVLKDALKVCGSVYRLNAASSSGYAFCGDDDAKEVAVGEYLYSLPSDVARMNADHFDGYIDFNNNTLTDFQSGEVVKC